MLLKHKLFVPGSGCSLRDGLKIKKVLVECEGAFMVRVNTRFILQAWRTMEFQTLTMISPVFWQGLHREAGLPPRRHALVL